MKERMGSHTRSVYSDTEAAEFMEWLSRTWAQLPPEKKAAATFEVRSSVAGFFMVGFKWDLAEPKTDAA